MGGRCFGDYTLRHPDLVDGAEEERIGRENPEGCGALEGEGDELQSQESNSRTAAVLWDLAEMMARREVYGEIHWRYSEEERRMSTWEVISKMVVGVTVDNQGDVL